MMLDDWRRYSHLICIGYDLDMIYSFVKSLPYFERCSFLDVKKSYVLACGKYQLGLHGSGPRRASGAFYIKEILEVF
jgi:hypothetical protein